MLHCRFEHERLPWFAGSYRGDRTLIGQIRPYATSLPA